jgi:hypothetical protein
LGESLAVFIKNNLNLLISQNFTSINSWLAKIILKERRKNRILPYHFQGVGLQNEKIITATYRLRFLP